MPKSFFLDDFEQVFLKSFLFENLCFNILYFFVRKSFCHYFVVVAYETF